MQSDNLTRNIEHYDVLYRKVKVDNLVKTVKNFESFLDSAIKIDTSWHALYKDNFSNRLKGKRVLELGCGDGLNALIMATLGAQVLAIDISAESERLIQESAIALQLDGIQVVSGDFITIPLEKHSFDFIVGKSFLHHLTHEIEDVYLKKIALLLKIDGEARFFEPAVNNKILDGLRWVIPVPGRPSSLNRYAFAQYKMQDPHPERDNSSDHFLKAGRQYFDDITITHIGSLERFCRLLPQGAFNRSFRRWAHRVELKLPLWFRYQAARSQLIVYKNPLAIYRN